MKKNKVFLTTLFSLVALIAFGQTDTTSNGEVGEAGFTLLEKISTAIGIISTILATFFGFKTSSVTDKADKAIAKGNEALSLASAAISYLKDGKVTPEEIADLVARYKILKG